MVSQATLTETVSRTGGMKVLLHFVTINLYLGTVLSCIKQNKTKQKAGFCDWEQQGTKNYIHWSRWKTLRCLTSWKLCVHILTSTLCLHSLFKLLQSHFFPCCSTETVLTVGRLCLNYPNPCVLNYLNPYLLTAPSPWSLIFSPLLIFRLPFSSFFIL